MIILYRIIIMFGFGVPGLFLGAFWAGNSGATQGAGLAGGAIVVGYALFGAMVTMVAGMAIAKRLSKTALPRTAAAMGALILLFVTYASILNWNMKQSHLDPPEAYNDIPTFTLTLERTDRADPVLARRLTVNSSDREWTSVLPDRRTCSAQASAESLRQAVAALAAFLEETGGTVTCAGEPETIIRWSLNSNSGSGEGRVDLEESCLQTEKEAQHLISALQQVSLMSSAPVRCR